MVHAMCVVHDLWPLLSLQTASDTARHCCQQLTLYKRCLIDAPAPAQVDEHCCGLHGGYGCCTDQLVGLRRVRSAAARERPDTGWNNQYVKSTRPCVKQRWQTSCCCSQCRIRHTRAGDGLGCILHAGVAGPRSVHWQALQHRVALRAQSV
jgi:hypothetical protein